MNISFIGYGNLAKAIVHGLLKQKIYTISVSSPSLSEGITPEGIHTFNTNKAAISHANAIILAVKPAQMLTVLQDVASDIPPNCVIVSVAAGLQLPWFAQHLPSKQAIIRTMPNTPASIGLGATPLFANAWVSEAQKQQVEAIFASVGITTWAQNERDMDTFTALSGSGPAYVFYFMEALVETAVKLGLDEQVAKAFSLQTMAGALGLAQKSDEGFAQLRAKVTSPGGTTAAALGVLEGQLDGLMLRAMQAAKVRAEELGVSN